MRETEKEERGRESELIEDEEKKVSCIRRNTLIHGLSFVVWITSSTIHQTFFFFFF